MKKAVIFDLDGTLLDTTKDIGLALGRTFGTTFSDKETDTFIGRGLKNAVRSAATSLGLENPDIETLHQRLLDFYRQTPVLHTKPFPGVTELLLWLNASRIPVCVYTNKEQDLADTVLGNCFPTVDFSMVAGMHGGYEKKPSSQAIDAFLGRVDVSRADALYVGDSEVDFNTAITASIDYRILTWGQRSRESLLGSGVPEKNLIEDMSPIRNLF